MSKHKWWDVDDLLTTYHDHIFAPYENESPDICDKYEAYNFYCASVYLGEYRDILLNLRDVRHAPQFMPPSDIEEDWHPNVAIMNLLESQTRMLMGVETEDDIERSIHRLLIARAILLLKSGRQNYGLVAKLPGLTDFFRNPPPGVPPLYKVHVNDFGGMVALFATLTGLDDFVHDITDEYRLKVDLWRQEVLGPAPLLLHPAWFHDDSEQTT
jgi:hypothetical protein